MLYFGLTPLGTPAIADETPSLNGGIYIQSSILGNLGIKKPLSGQSVFSSSISGELKVVNKLDGQIDIDSVVTGALGIKLPLSGIIQSRLNMDNSTLGIKLPLNGEVDIVSSGNADMTVLTTMSGEIRISTKVEASVDYALNFKQYKKAIEGEIVYPLAKIQFLNEDETFDFEVFGEVLGGRLGIRKEDGVRRTAEVSLSNIDGKFRLSEDDLWVRRKFKLYLGLKILGKDVYYPQGVFVLSRSSLRSGFSDTKLRISGIDKWSNLNGVNGGNLISPIIFNNGTNVKSIVDAILIQAKDPKVCNFLGGGQNTSYKIIRSYGSNTYADILLELARFLSYEIYYDVEGRLTMHEINNPMENDSSWDYTTDERAYLGSDKSIDYTNAYNVVRVIGANLNGDIIVGTAKNENPNSPTSIQAIGEKELPPIIEDIYRTVSQAEGYAKYRLEHDHRMPESVSLKSVKMYHLDVGDVSTIKDDKGQYNKDDKYEIRSIDLGLAPSATMSLSLLKSI